VILLAKVIEIFLLQTRMSWKHPAMRDDTCALLKRVTSAYEGPDTYFSDNGQERLVRPWCFTRSTLPPHQLQTTQLLFCC